MSPWECGLCTFINQHDVPRCGICESARTEPVQSIDADHELAKRLQQQYLEEEKTHETTPTNTNNPSTSTSNTNTNNATPTTNTSSQRPTARSKKRKRKRHEMEVINTSTSASPTNTNNAPPTDNTMDTSSQRPTTRSVRVVPQTSGTFTSYTSAQIKRERKRHDHEMELAASTDTVPPMIEIKHEPYDAPFLFSNTPCGPSSYDMSWVTCVESDDDNEDVEDVEDVEEEDDNEDSPYMDDIYDSEATISESGAMYGDVAMRKASAGGLEGVGRGRGRGCNFESDLNGLEGVGRGRGRGCNFESDLNGLEGVGRGRGRGCN
eukprot:572938_1